MSKTILAHVDGWTPLIDSVTLELGVVCSAVFGRVWRYCQAKDGVCYASINTIADELKLGYNTVLAHLQELVNSGYLEDTTPEIRNRPHTYRDTGKAAMEITITAGAPKRDDTGGLQNLDTSSNRSPKIGEHSPEFGDRSPKIGDPGIQNLEMKRVFKKELKKEDEETIFTQNSNPLPSPSIPILGKSYSLEEGWQIFCDAFVDQGMAAPMVQAWTNGTRPVSYSDGVLMVNCKDCYSADFLNSRLSKTAQRTIEGMTGQATQVQFVAGVR